MKKYFLPTALLVMCSFTFFACNKKSVTKPAVTIPSYWYGTYTNNLFGEPTEDENEGVALKSDGTCTIYDFIADKTPDAATCSNKAYGTYSITGSSITFTQVFAKIHNETFNCTGTINTSASPNTMSGSFTSPNGGGSGTFNFAKQ